MEGSNYFNKLPEDCVSEILSLTSPLDACRSSLVFSTFRSATESDMVWERFLPSDYHDMVSRSVVPLNFFSSKKQLFLLLCNPLLIDNGHLSFKIEKSSGRKSYFLSARALSITWSSQPLNWCWIHMTESRFEEVGVLRTTSWLEIEGKIRSGMLSQNTKYGGYLVIKIRDGAYGLDCEKAETSIEVGGDTVWTASVNILSNAEDGDHDHDQEEEVPREREDGWMEIKLGEFFINGDDDDDQEVKMSFKEVKSYRLKGGLIVEGIEVRPIPTNIKLPN